MNQDTSENPNERQVGGSHYRSTSKMQHWDLMYALYGDAWFRGNVTKYTERFKAKKGLEDLQKALHYAEKWASIKFVAERVRSIAYVEDDVLEEYMEDHSFSFMQRLIFRAVLATDRKRVVEYCREHIRLEYPDALPVEPKGPPEITFDMKDFVAEPRAVGFQELGRRVPRMALEKGDIVLYRGDVVTFKGCTGRVVSRLAHGRLTNCVPPYEGPIVRVRWDTKTYRATTEGHAHPEHELELVGAEAGPGTPEDGGHHASVGFVDPDLDS